MRDAPARHVCARSRRQSRGEGQNLKPLLMYRGYVSNASESRHEVLLGCIPVRLAKTQQNHCKAWSQIHEDDAPLAHTSAVIGIDTLVPAVLKIIC